MNGGAMLILAAAGFSLGICLLTAVGIRIIAGAGRWRRLSPLLQLRGPSRWTAFWTGLPDKVGGAKLERQIRLAGTPFGLRASTFQMLRIALCFCAAAFFASSAVSGNGPTPPVNGFPLLRYLLLLTLLWFGPYVWLVFEAKRRRALLLYELTRLSHRLSVVISGQTDLRDAVLRAGRTSKLLRPFLNELATGWNTGQFSAIVAFGEGIGLSEAYPLVNTLLAATRIEAREVAAMLGQQVESIDKSMEHETLKRIENVPLYLVLLIMLPFTVVFVLMIYPWMTYMSELLLQAF